jgi:RNA polymerase sigma factor for flagellar operon FliA
VPPQVSFEELHNAALIGLWDASKTFDESRGYQFSTFAAFRVRGEMKDHLRSLSRGPRTSEQPVVFSLDPTDDDNRNFRQLIPSEAPSPVEQFILSESIELMLVALKEIPDQYAFVLRRYYLESALMREIAEELGLTEGRISQIRVQAIDRLQWAMGIRI